MKLLFFSLLLGILVLFLDCSIVNAQKPEDCLLTTKLGVIQGTLELSRNEKRFCSYKGIPYTNTPKRFEEAELGGPWTGVKDATEFGPICPQLVGVGADAVVAGEENCLFVNVHYPLDDQCQGIVNSTNDLLPVMLHIHGGAYYAGSGGEWGNKYIMDYCTVVISINYRLGALGFLTSSDGLIPGNLGLKDAVVALKWTQENIDSFGGDPTSVTIIGMSAGSGAVSSLLVSPLAKGLFHRAIAMSGSAIAPVFSTKNPMKLVKELASRLNCNNDDTWTSAELKECLLKEDFKNVVKNQFIYRWGTDPIIPIGPVVENLNAKNPFQTVDPLYKLIAGDFNRVPLIMGFSEDEGAALQAFPNLLEPELVSDMNSKWEEVAPTFLNYDDENVPEDEKNKISRTIRHNYFGYWNVSMETLQSLVDLHSDRYFVQGIFDTVELYSRYAPVYPYVYTYKKGFCYMCEAGYPFPVATHGTDIEVLFQVKEFPEIHKGTPIAEYSDKYLKLWTTFVRTGIPSETWPAKNLMKPYKNDGVNPYNWYQIDEEMSELQDYLKDRREFWRGLGLRPYDNPVDY